MTSLEFENKILRQALLDVLSALSQLKIAGHSLISLDAQLRGAVERAYKLDLDKDA